MPRIIATREQLRFETLIEEDTGNYICRLNRPTQRHSASPNERRIHLRVNKPSIGIIALSIGSHYISLAWNDSLRVKASDRVGLSLDVKDDKGKTNRVIRLSMYNPWYSYNVMRLKPLTVFINIIFDFHLI